MISIEAEFMSKAPRDRDWAVESRQTRRLHQIGGSIMVAVTEEVERMGLVTPKSKRERTKEWTERRNKKVQRTKPEPSVYVDYANNKIIIYPIG